MFNVLDWNGGEENGLLTEYLEKKYGEIRCQVVSQSKKIRECSLNTEAGQPLVFAVSFFEKGLGLAGKAEEAHGEILRGSAIGQTFKKFNFKIRRKPIEMEVVSLPIWLITYFGCGKNKALTIFYECVIESETMPPFTYAYILELFNPSNFFVPDLVLVIEQKRKICHIYNK